MTKTFLHALLTFMLGVLIYANLLYAFTMTSITTTVGGLSLDMSNKYLGVSNFINFMQSTDGFGNLLNNMFLTINKFGTWIIGHFNGQIWIKESFNVFEFIFNFLSYFILPFLFIANLLGYLAYVIMLIFYLITKIFTFLGGAYSSDMWQYTYAVTTPVLETIKSFI